MRDVRKQTPRPRTASSPAVLVSFSQGATFERAMVMVESHQGTLPSNKIVEDLILADVKAIASALPCWTGTITAYRKPGEKLGSEIVFTNSRGRRVFPVPVEFRNEEDSVLVVEHPNFTIEADGKDRVIISDKVDIVRGFPARNGWYLTDSQYCIPNGGRTSRRNPDSRHLRRARVFVGPIVRGFRSIIIPFDPLQNIEMTSPSSQGLGIIMMPSEKPERPKPSLTIPGMDPDEFAALLQDARRNLVDLAQFVSPERLRSLFELLRALDK